MTGHVVAGRYRLEERLSTTPMAEVWAATDPVLERRVVVKLLAGDADRARFEREARAAAALAHPNVVQLFDFGEDAGRPFMVLEHLPGGTLDERLRDGQSLPDDETQRIAVDVATGLAHAHLHGVVHRDLKPANVLFDDEGRAKVGDFGIAHVQGLDTLSETGTVLGTALAMAPEQVEGHRVTPAADVYAFGVLLYRLLTGRYPFESESPIEVARMQRDVEPPPIRRVRPDAPEALAALAAAALAKNPNARPADGTALLAALGETVPPPTMAAEAATAIFPRPPRLRRRRLAFGIAAMLLLLAAGVAAAIMLTGTHTSAPALSTTHRRTRSRPTTTHASVPVTAATTAPTTTSTPKPTTTRSAPPPPPPPTTTAPATTTTSPTTTAATTTP